MPNVHDCLDMFLTSVSVLAATCAFALLVDFLIYMTSEDKNED